MYTLNQYRDIKKNKLRQLKKLELNLMKMKKNQYYKKIIELGSYIILKKIEKKTIEKK
jgi:hypothetical protein